MLLKIILTAEGSGHYGKVRVEAGRQDILSRGRRLGAGTAAVAEKQEIKASSSLAVVTR